MDSPPPGIRLVETPDGFEVSTPFRHGLFTTYAVLLAVSFTIAGVGACSLGLAAFRHAGTEGWGKPVAFTLIGLLISYIGICASLGAFIHLFGVFVFRVAGDEAMFTTRFFGRNPGKWARTFRWSQVTDFSAAMADGHPPTPEFALILRDGTRIVFLDSIRGKKQAFLTAFFARKVAELAAQ